ncbi:MAG: glucans biosynthesis glucosyltransferase MdoH [Caldimonas sp.]
MTPQLPQPPFARASMHFEAWAGHPLRRAWRRLFGRAELRRPRAAHDVRRPMLRRLMLLAFVIFGAVVGTRAMAQVLPQNGATHAEQALLLLFGTLFGWISAGFWTGVMGAWVLLRNESGHTLLGSLRQAPEISIDSAPRTAIVMPICNEHVPTVFGGLRATYESLVRTGSLGGFDFFVLSDTNQPDLRAAEQAAWSGLVAALQAELPDGAPPVRFYYRWRQRRTKRKAGNVADFARRWGRAYGFMVVLDADSVMTGECVTTLVRLMEANPGAGIIQTAPRACGHQTLHARVLQFSARVYGPLFTAGMQFWQLGESHYWGHNAILRVRPFIEHCGLPPLPGNGSLSGEVLSHDFVEAALMRRAGWKVWVVSDLPGTYEQVPPNLLAELQRDRRWCHGNLQNARLMFEPSLHAVHRSVFVTGVLAYASAPLWLGFLLLSTLLFTRHAHDVPIYFFEPYQMFPIWPTANLKLILTLFGLTGVLLLAPKAMSLFVVLVRQRAWCFGGVLRLIASAFIEFLHSLLLAPVRMLFHTQFFIAALTGWRLEWKSPPRGDASTSWREAWRRHGLHTLFAIAWVGTVRATGAPFPWWLSPIILGLLAGAPLSVWGSRVSVGRALKRAGLLMIPEELETPQVLIEARRHAARIAESTPGFVGAVVDAEFRRCVGAANLFRPTPTGRKAAVRAERISRALMRGPAAVDDEERLRLLGDTQALAEMHARIERRLAAPQWLGGAQPAPTVQAGTGLEPRGDPVQPLAR